VTLNDLYWAWRIDGPTSTSDISRVLRFLREVGRESEASGLTEARIVAYLAELRSVTPSDRTYSNHVVTIRGLFGFAVRSGVLAFNPMVELLPVWSKRIKKSHPRVTRPGTRAMSLGPLESAEKKELAEIEAELAHEGVDTKRPKTLEQCPPDDAPCPFASCRHSLLADPGAGVVKLTWPGRDIEELAETCSLRSARRFAIRAKSFPRTRRDLQVVASTDEVGAALNLSPMRISQIEEGAIAKLRLALEAIGG